MMITGFEVGGWLLIRKQAQILCWVMLGYLNGVRLKDYADGSLSNYKFKKMTGEAGQHLRNPLIL